MKKLLLSLAAIATMTLSASALDWYVCGAFEGWNVEAAPQMEAQADGTFKLEVANMKSGFKITNAQAWNSGEWAFKSGQDKLELGVPTTIYNNDNGGTDDITFAAGDVVKNAVLILDVTNAEQGEVTLTVTGTVDSSNPELFMVGDFTKPNGWNFTDAVPFVETNGVYKLTYTFEGAGEFKISAEGWAPQWGSATENGIIFTDENLSAVITKKAGVDPKNLKFDLTGEYEVTFVLATNTLSFASTAGVEAIIAEENVVPVYYNLQGVRVDNPQNGLFIKVVGNKTSKVVK